VKRFRHLMVTLAVLLSGAAVEAQGFGLPLLKSKVTLQRKLPALVQLPGTSVKIVVITHSDLADLKEDFKSMLSSELLKEDPRLSIDPERAESTINCQIMTFEHPQPTTSTRPGVPTGKSAPKPVTYTRVTGMMRVSFQAVGHGNKTLGSDNIVAKYDEEFDTSGNTLSGGVTGAVKNSWKRIAGGAKSENLDPPTDAELRTKLLTSAVQQIVVQLVNTRETIDVLLARGKGMDAGVKDAEAGLWSRAMESWETMTPLPKPIDDAYRLYDAGVAYEAMAYAAEDIPAAMKFLDQAAIDYGKAIDSNPGEKYFLEPQRRIETALAHYEKLKQQDQAATTSAAKRRSKS